MTSRPSILRCIAAALALAGAAGVAWEAGAQSLEYQVKAAYLAKFAPFVQWPAASLPPEAPLSICVAGANPFGPALQALSRQSLGERRIAVRVLANPRQAQDCHVLYARGGGKEALAEVRGRPVLTVTDAADGSGGPRGIVHFVLDRNRVRFEVDAEAAAENQLVISSKLQTLAVPAARARGRP